MLTLLFGFSLAHAGNSVEFTCSEENVWKGLGEKPERLRHARRVYSKTIDPDQLYRDFNSGWKNSSPILISENCLEIYLVPSMDEGANRYLDLTFMIENYFNRRGDIIIRVFMITSCTRRTNKCCKCE